MGPSDTHNSTLNLTYLPPSAASAFTGVAPAKPSTQLNAADSRRAFLTSAAGAAAAVVGASPAFAIRDYEVRIG